ncbi:MAG: SH3 domain-containing protein [Aggregatilineales bacterium]
MRRKLLVALVLNALLALTIGSQLNAQTTLTYGDRMLGEVSTAQPQVFFSFSGETGDMVTASVIGASSGMTPTLGINAPSGQQLAFNTGVMGAGLVDAQVTVQLPDAGVYTIQVGAPADGQGSFLLILDGQPETELPVIDTSIEVNLTGEAAQTFALQGDLESILTMQILPLDDEPFTVEIYDSDGLLLAVINGVVAQIELPASDGEFRVVVDAPDVTSVQISVGITASVVESFSPESTEEVTNATPLSPNACTVSSGNNVNVRSGAGTEFSIVGTMRNNTLAEARTSNGWIQITFQGQAGYVFAEIVTLGGNCSNLDIIDVDTTNGTSPTATSTTADVTATSASTESTQPTATVTQAAPTESVEEAPTDSDPLSFAIDRANGGSFTQTVSYPGGDNRDRITTTVSLNQNPPNNEATINLTLTCSGTGTENIRWTRSSPNAQQYTCGDTIQWRYAHPQGSMDYYVFFADGSPTSYVTYTLVANVAP